MNRLRINLATVEACTEAMGPGKRLCFWVGGCKQRCAGCISEKFQVARPENDRSPAEVLDLLELIHGRDQLEGVSFSGGEPFLYAEALSVVAMRAQALGLTVLAWSGYTLEYLTGSKAPPGAIELIANLDILIDGPFRQDLTSLNTTLRGSTNQRIHFLTDRYGQDDLTRVIEARLTSDSIEVIGVTDYQLLLELLRALGVPS